MGVKELRDSFNLVASPAFTCSRALLDYVTASDTQWQVITFSGMSSTGAPFSIKSDRIRPNGDIIIASRQTAQRLLDQNPQGGT